MNEPHIVDLEHQKKLELHALALTEYRNNLSACEIKSQESYDNTLVTLSAGALGVSIAFVKDIIGDNEPIIAWVLIAAWFMWAASLTFVVSSFYFSQRALTTAIKRYDDGRHTDPSDGWAKATAWLNGLAGLTFVLGVLFLCVFTAVNLNQKYGVKCMIDDKHETFTKGLLPQQAPILPASPEGKPFIGQLPQQAPVISPAPGTTPAPASTPAPTSEHAPTANQD